MTTDGDDRIDDLLDRAADLPRGERDAFLDRECAGDPGLKSRLLALLASLDLAEAEGFFAPPAPELPPGARVGHYKLLRRIGVGATGVVYEARHVELRQTVALKLLDPRLARNRVAFARFRREVVTLGGLRHPNVVAGVFANTTGPHVYLVTELLDGASLREVIRRASGSGHALPVGAACEVGRQVADGLAALAEVGLVHRDVSPSNVFLTTGGWVKLIDFGLVRLAAPGPRPEEWLTAGNSPLGNPAYMAPEQFRAPALVDPRADLYGLGCVLYHLLAGFAPFFDRGPADRAELPRLHATAPPTPLGTVRSDLPPGLVAVVERLLAKDPQDRFGSAREVSKLLSPHADAAGLPALVEAVPRPASGDPEPATLPGTGSRGRSRLLGALIVLATLLVAAGLTARFLRSAGPEPSPHTAAPALWEPVPLTSALGREITPRLSPDGTAVAYVWAGPRDENVDVYVKQIGHAEPRRLTTNPDHDIAPAWAPDGTRIAFSRRAGTGSLLLTIDPDGGREEEVAALDEQVSHLDWSPDGRALVFALAKSKAHPPGVYFLALGTGATRRVVGTPAGSRDYFPRVSPDGSRVAFVRQVGTYTEDQLLCVAPAGGGFEPDTVLRRRGFFRGVDWTADGAELVFSFGRSGRNRLWRVPASGGEPTEVRLPLDSTVTSPAVARRGNRLAFGTNRDEWTVWRLHIPDDGGPPPQPEDLFASNRSDDAPAYSPDGRRVAFTSDRTGAGEIWVYDITTRAKRPITSFNGPDVGSPQWHPDGRQVVFDSTSDGRSRLFVVDTEAPPRQPRQVPTGDIDSACLPCWSRDGHWIVFVSRSGSEERLWKVALDGVRPTRLTDCQSTSPKMSHDGAWVYFLRDGKDLCKVPLAGGGVSEVPGHAYYWNTWALGRRGAYSFEANGRVGERIIYRAFEGRESRPVGDYRVERRYLGGRYPGGRIAVSPDEAELLYVQYSRDGSNIYFIDGFR